MTASASQRATVPAAPTTRPFGTTAQDWTDGRMDRGLRFDPARKPHLEVTSTPALSPTAAVTVAAWAHATAWCGAGATDEVARRILQKADEPTQYRLLCEAGKLVFGIATVNLTADLPSTNDWHHLAGSYDGATLRLYVDGQLVNQMPASGPLRVTTEPLYIGAKNPWGFFFQGTLDEIAIFDRALSDAEIGALAAGRQPAAVY